jgi:hypothetical protein
MFRLEACLTLLPMSPIAGITGMLSYLALKFQDKIFYLHLVNKNCQEIDSRWWIDNSTKLQSSHKPEQIGN